MVFSSLLFIFRFLPIVLAIYFIVPSKMKNLVLFLVSLVFYSFGEPRYVLLMISSIFVDYFAGILIENSSESIIKRRIALGISLTFNVGVLFIFKYFNFFVDSLNSTGFFSLDVGKIALPLGISFYTFQTMSYSIDIYRRRIKAERNIINFATFVTLFPQLIAGPIVKYSDISDSLKNRKINFDMLEKGIILFVFGLGKKVLIANNIGLLWREVEKVGFSNLGTSLAWLGAVAFSIQIYFDFSGYSMMARGLGAMVGFEFPCNFNYPFISRSICEFWRRWHITLGSWFKEYVYIELGGNRKGILRTIINLFIVWAITGLWHGASYNFILWGLFFFIIIVLEKQFLSGFLEKYKGISHIYSIVIILISFVIFSITDINDIGIYLGKMLILSKGVGVIYYLRNYFVVIVLAILLSTPIVKKIYVKHIKGRDILNYLLVFLIFIFSIAYLVDSTYNPFLYFRF